jgi:hypothetical protein
MAILQIKVFMILIFFAFWSSIGFAEVYNKEYWVELTHSQHGKIEQNGHDTTYNELTELIGQRGLETACLHPARYTYLKNIYQNNLPEFDLNKCEKLQNFSRKYQTKYISLGFASEFMESPGSMFGHIFLIFHNHKNPELHSQVVHFSALANLNEDGFFKYIFNGIGGKYNAKFFSTTLFEKINEYNQIEQRDIYIYNLKFNSSEKKMLAYQLYELENIKFNYYFFKTNCAFFIESLINISQGKITKSNWLYTLPYDVVRNNKTNIKSMGYFPSYKKKFDFVFRKLKKYEIEKFNKIINGKKKLRKSDSKKLKIAIFYYYQYKFRKNRLVLPYFKENLLVAKTQNPYQKLKKKDNPLNTQSSQMIAFSSSHFQNSSKESFIYRPVLIDRFNFQKDHIVENKIFEFQVTHQNGNYSLGQLDILKLKNFNPTTKYDRQISVDFGLGFNRLNVNEDLRPDIVFGLGQTFKNVAFYNYFLKIGFDHEFYLNPEINIFYDFNHKSKLVFQAGQKIWEEIKMEFLELYLNNKIQKDFEFMIFTGHDSERKNYLGASTRLFF